MSGREKAGGANGKNGRLLRLWSIPLVPLLLMLLGCTVTPAPLPQVTATAAPVTVRVGVVEGAAAIVDLVERPFAEFAPQSGLQLVVGSEQELTAALAAGRLDGLLTYMPPAGGANWVNPVAWDGLVLFVNKSNPIADLHPAEAQALFAGQVASWDGFGGAAEGVRLMVQPDEAAATMLLQERLLAGLPLAVGAQVVSGQEVAMKMVRGDEGETAVSYGMLSRVENEVKLLTIDGIQATKETLITQVYPLAMPLYFVSGGVAEPTGGMRDFAAWLQSEAGQAVIGERFGRVRE